MIYTKKSDKREDPEEIPYNDNIVSWPDTAFGVSRGTSYLVSSLM